MSSRGKRIRLSVRPYGVHFGIAPLFDVEAGGYRVKRGPVWIPDGLHIWVGRRGVHLFWSRESSRLGHVIFDRIEAEDLDLVY